MKILSDIALETAKATAANLALDQFKIIIFPVMVASIIVALAIGYWSGQARRENQYVPEQ